MQVKKYEAYDILQAVTEVKKDLGPDAIIISSKEVKGRLGQPSKFVVVAAVSNNQLKKKELAERKLGDKLTDSFNSKSALQQKSIIENVYKNIEKKHEQRKPLKITKTPYIEIGDKEEPVVAAKPQKVEAKPILDEPFKRVSTKGKKRVQMAAKAALKSSMALNLFKEKEQPKIIEEPKIKEVTPLAEIQPMMRKLNNCGVDAKIVEKLLDKAVKGLPGKLNKASVEAWCAKWFLQNVKTVEPASFKGVEVFVGPHGSGKTQSLLKLASDYVVNHRRRVAILTTDNTKVGATEQLKVYSRILNVRFEVLQDILQWPYILGDLEEYDNILIDTPGVGLNSTDEIEFIRAITSTKIPRQVVTHLVLSGMMQSAEIPMVTKRFKVTNFKDVIFTNLDQTTQHGVLINFQNQFGVPFHSFGLGSDIIDGFEWATRERVLDLIFKLTRINGEKDNGNLL